MRHHSDKPEQVLSVLSWANPMQDRHKRQLAIAGMILFFNLAIVIYFAFEDFVFTGTFLILFSFSIYFYEINR